MTEGKFSMLIKQPDHPNSMVVTPRNRIQPYTISDTDKTGYYPTKCKLRKIK